MSVYICESVNLNGEASDEASPFSLIQPSMFTSTSCRSFLSFHGKIFFTSFNL